MKIVEIITDLENKNGEKILKIIINDALVLCIRFVLFLIVLFIGKKIIEFILNRLESVSHEKLDIGA